MSVIETVGELISALQNYNHNSPVFIRVRTGMGCDTCGFGDTEEVHIEIHDLESRLVLEGA